MQLLSYGTRDQSVHGTVETRILNVHIRQESFQARGILAKGRTEGPVVLAQHCPTSPHPSLLGRLSHRCMEVPR